MERCHENPTIRHGPDGIDSSNAPAQGRDMKPNPRVLLAIVAIAMVGAVVWLLRANAKAPRGEALEVALHQMIEKKDAVQGQLAGAIWNNYHETRSNAARWSGVYWGFTFLAAALSALAGLVLKLEILAQYDRIKKDVAALFAVTAALLITISTSGDFQRKWQANRIAAAELERLGYELLGNTAGEPHSYFDSVAQILHNRNMAIVGNTEPRKPAVDPSKDAPSH